MTTYQIEYDLSELKKLSDQFARNVGNAPEEALPNTAAAFQRATQAVAQMWKGYLRGETTLNGIDFMSGITSSMVNSIRSRRNSDFNYTVFSDNIQLEQKTHGSKTVEYDMKKTHPYGKDSRVSKKGIPYLIIPFRWRTPQKSETLAHGQYFSNIIPQANYETNVKGLEISEKNALKNYFEKNFRGENIERQGYDWAKFGRLKEDMAWNDRSVGMVRMKDATKSMYFTFRIISAKSPAGSWIYHREGKPGVDVLSALERTAKPIIDKIIEKGIAADDDFYKNQH